MFNQDMESKNEALLKELIARSEELDRESEALFKDIEIEDIDAFLTNPLNFTNKEWQHIQRKQKELEEMLDREIKNIRDPRKSKKSFDALNVPNYSLFVR